MRAALLLLPLIATACASVERAPAPTLAEQALPPAFAALDGDGRGGGTLAGLLPAQDPAFTSLERAALADGPTLAAALARIDAARAAVRGARAEYFPELAGSGTVTRERFNPQQFGAPAGSITPERTTYRLNLDASWDPDLFGRLRASARAAAARLDAATADAAGVRLALRTDIARAVTDARAVDARLAIARADLARAEELVRLTRSRTAAGVSPGLDLVRAEALAADAASRLEPLALERATIIGALVTLTGAPAQQVQNALATPTSAVAPSSPPALLPSTLIRSRPDIVAAERRLAAADAEIAAAAAERWPRLSITAALGLFALGPGALFDDDALTGSLGAGLAGPLLDFGRVGARIDARRADARAAFADYRRVLFTALGEAEAALGALAAADRRVARLATQVALDTDAAGLARARYGRGLDDFLTVLDAERSAFASRAALAEAEAEAGRRRIALYAAVGGEPGV